MSFEKRLEELGIELPATPAPAGNYLPAVVVKGLCYTAGAICLREGRMVYTGKVGAEQTVEDGYQAARVCALNLLAAVRGALGSLDKVQRVVTVTGYVNGVAGFADSPKVINGASDLIVDVFGEAGKHARAAVAVAGLPADSTVEVQAVFEVEE